MHLSRFAFLLLLTGQALALIVGTMVGTPPAMLFGVALFSTWFSYCHQHRTMDLIGIGLIVLSGLLFLAHLTQPITAPLTLFLLVHIGAQSVSLIRQEKQPLDDAIAHDVTLWLSRQGPIIRDELERKGLNPHRPFTLEVTYKERSLSGLPRFLVHVSAGNSPLHDFPTQTEFRLSERLSVFLSYKPYARQLNAHFAPGASAFRHKFGQESAHDQIYRLARKAA